MPDRFEVDPSDRIINRTCEAIDEVIKGITPQMVRRYALLQAAAVISTAVYHTKDDRIDVRGTIDLAERLLAEIERREQ